MQVEESGVSGFSEHPFNESSDTRFLYLGGLRHQALSRVISITSEFFADTEGGRVIVVTGDEGGGKSSFLLAVAERLRLSPGVVVLGAEPVFACRETTRLGDIVAHCRNGKTRPGNDAGPSTRVLLLDDADRLPEEVIRRIREPWGGRDGNGGQQPPVEIMIMTATAPPVDFAAVLGAEPSLVIPLAPFDGAEVNRLIRHRLRTAGYRGPDLFTSEAVEQIVRHGGGNPMQTTRLCALTWEIASREFAAPILPEFVEEAAAELLASTIPERSDDGLLASAHTSAADRPPEGRVHAPTVALSPSAIIPLAQSPPGPEFRRISGRLRLGLAMVALIAAATLGYMVGRESIRGGPVDATAAADSAAASPPSIPIRTADNALAHRVHDTAAGRALDPPLERSAAPTVEAETAAPASDIETAAGPPPSEGSGAGTVVPVPDIVASDGTGVSPVSAPPAADLASESSVPAVPAHAPTRAESGQAKESPAPTSTATVKPEVAESNTESHRTADPQASAARTAVTATPGKRPSASPSVKAVKVTMAQTLLARLGYDPGPADGIIGPQTRAAVEAFQRDRGVRADGTVTDGLLARLREQLASRSASSRQSEPASGLAWFSKALGFDMDSVNEPDHFRDYCRRNPDTWIFDSGTDRLVFCGEVIGQHSHRSSPLPGSG